MSRKAFFLWSNRLFWSSTTLGFAGAVALVAFAKNPDGSNTVVSDSLALTVVKFGFLVLASVPLIVGIRCAVMKVIVTHDEVVVRGPFRTVRLNTSDVVDLVAPDFEPVQFIPRLRTRDGQSIKLFAVSRLKNRMWGDAKHMRASLRELAAHLDVPLIEDQSAAKSMHWG